MQNTTNTPEKSFPAGRLAAGIVLLIIGIAGFSDAIDLWEPRELWRLWPLGMVLIGVVGEAGALQRRKSDGSYVLIAIGVWFLAAMHRFLDLRWGSSMPLGIVIIGLGLAIHAIIDLPEKKENGHELC